MLKSARPSIASFPGPARSSLAVRNSRRGPGFVHHVMRAAAYVTTLLLESDELAPCLPLKEAPRDHSNGSRANLPKC